MVTSWDIYGETYRAVHKQLAERRPDRQTWPDKDVPLGGSNSGFGFTDQTIRRLVRDIYRQLKASDLLRADAADFGVPDDFLDQVDKLLDGDANNLERWITANISKQLGVS